MGRLSRRSLPRPVPRSRKSAAAPGLVVGTKNPAVIAAATFRGCGLGSLPRSLCSMNWQTPTPLHVLEISWRPSVPVFLRRAYRTLLIRSLWCSDDTMLWKTAPKLRFRSDQPCAYSSLCAFESELRPHQPGADD